MSTFLSYQGLTKSQDYGIAQSLYIGLDYVYQYVSLVQLNYLIISILLWRFNDISYKTYINNVKYILILQFIADVNQISN